MSPCAVIDDEDEHTLETEQATLDDQLDIAQDLALRLQTLIDDSNAPSTVMNEKSRQRESLV